MKNNKKLIIIGAIVLVILIIGMSFVSKYNSFVEIRENVNNKESNVNVTLQRRGDLIPNLVNVVKGYVSHEEKVINDITTARENLLKANNMKEKSEADKQLTASLNALMVIVENYPDLKANENFINLQDELSGTENRISVARRDYNEAVTSYNSTIKKFPNNLIANMFGFDEFEYFEASNTEVPKVDFD